MSTELQQRDRLLLRTSQDGIIGGGKSVAGGLDNCNNAETVETQVGQFITAKISIYFNWV